MTESVFLEITALRIEGSQFQRVDHLESVPRFLTGVEVRAGEIPDGFAIRFPCLNPTPAVAVIVEGRAIRERFIGVNNHLHLIL